MSKTKPKTKPVWLLMITHRHGHDISLHSTEDKARVALLDYVDDNWDDEMSGEQKPPDAADRISFYFDTLSELGGDDEFYDINPFKIDA